MQISTRVAYLALMDLYFAFKERLKSKAWWKGNKLIKPMRLQHLILTLKDTTQV